MITNKDELMQKLQEDTNALVSASRELKNDKEVVMAFLQKDGRLLEHVSEQLKNDKEVVHLAVQNYGPALLFAGPAACKDTDICASALIEMETRCQNDIDELDKIEEMWQKVDASILYNVEDIVNAWESSQPEHWAYQSKEERREQLILKIHQQGEWDESPLKYAGIEFRDEEEVVLEAVRMDLSALQYASDRLRNDSAFFEKAMQVSDKGRELTWQHHLHVLKFAGEQLKNNKEFVLHQIRDNGYGLQYASETLKNDKEIVMEAVQRKPGAIEFASEELQKDIDVVKIAVKEGRARSFEKLDEQVKNDRGLAMELAHQNGAVLLYLNDEFKSDEEIVKAAINNNGYAIECAAPELQQKKSIALLAVQSRPLALSRMPQFVNDRDVVTEAIKQNGDAIQYASNELRKDQELSELAVKQAYTALHYVGYQNVDMCIQAITQAEQDGWSKYHIDTLWQAIQPELYFKVVKEYENIHTEQTEDIER